MCTTNAQGTIAVKYHPLLIYLLFSWQSFSINNVHIIEQCLHKRTVCGIFFSVVQTLYTLSLGPHHQTPKYFVGECVPCLRNAKYTFPTKKKHHLSFNKNILITSSLRMMQAIYLQNNCVHMAFMHSIFLVDRK